MCKIFLKLGQILKKTNTLQDYNLLCTLIFIHHFTSFVVTMMTLFAITNYHRTTSWIICFNWFNPEYDPVIKINTKTMVLFTITHYHWAICWLICFIPLVELSFYTSFDDGVVISSMVHSGCDRSAKDAYSSMTPHATFAFVGRQYCPTFNVLHVFRRVKFNKLLSP
jgi:hypothetical protein